MKKFVNYILWYFGYIKDIEYLELQLKYSGAMKAIRIQKDNENSLRGEIGNLTFMNNVVRAQNDESQHWKEKYLWSEKEIEKINKANSINLITLNEEIDKLKEVNRQLTFASTMKKASILKKK